MIVETRFFDGRLHVSARGLLVAADLFPRDGSHEALLAALSRSRIRRWIVAGPPPDAACAPPPVARPVVFVPLDEATRLLPLPPSRAMVRLMKSLGR